MKQIKIIVVLIILISLSFSIYNQTQVNIVNNCKVIELQQQQLIKSNDGNMSTKIRYLVITDKETFICENSLLNGKFNNSDIFWYLKKDSIYNFKVAGIGKTFITDYRNILKVIL